MSVATFHLFLCCGRRKLLWPRYFRLVQEVWSSEPFATRLETETFVPLRCKVRYVGFRWYPFPLRWIAQCQDLSNSQLHELVVPSVVRSDPR